jgi:hypothetical protein
VALEAVRVEHIICLRVLKTGFFGFDTVATGDTGKDQVVFETGLVVVFGALDKLWTVLVVFEIFEAYFTFQALLMEEET